VVRLRMQGSCQSCPSSAITLQSTIEEAIYNQAPDVMRIEVEELPDGPLFANEKVSRIPLTLVQTR